MVTRQAATRAARPQPWQVGQEPPLRRLFGMTAPVALVVAVLGYGAVTAWGTLTYVVSGQLGMFSLRPAAAVVVLSLVWPVERVGSIGRAGSVGRVGRAARAGSIGRVWRRSDVGRLAATCGVLVVAHALIATLCGSSPVASLRASLIDTVLASALLAVYRRGCSGAEWFPTTPHQVRLLLALAGAYITAVVLLGGIPPVGVGGSGDPQLDVWLWCVGYIHVTQLLILGFAVLHPVRQYAPAQFRQSLPLGMVVGTGCLLLPALYPQYPLDWMVFVPALWMGVTLPLRVAVLAAMNLPVAAFAVGYLATGRDAQEPSLAKALGALLLVACLAMVVTIVVRREELARLLARVSDAAREEAEHSALVDAVIGSMNDGVLLITHAGSVVMSNPAAREMLGTVTTDRPERAGWLRGDAVRRQDGRPLSEQDIAGIVRPDPGQDVRRTVRSVVPGGGERFYTVTARALAGQESAMTLVVLADTTAEHARHRELEAFAGDVAHDLKGPLSAVAIWMDTAETEAEDDLDAGRDAMRRAQLASRRMTDTIDDCLAYTTTRAGNLHPRDVELGDVVREVASGYEAGGATVQIDLAGSVRADPTLLRRLIGNLIGNAVKYAKPGEPAWIRVSAVPDSTPGWTRISVADRGIGIDDTETETIFGKFSRTAHGSATGDGTGLGLALCRSIVSRHHGTISAHRNAWGGATLEFTLPQGRTLVR